MALDYRQGLLGKTALGGFHIRTHPGHTQFGRVAAGFHLIMVVPAVAVWGLSMKLAAMMARSAIRKVVHAAENMVPESPRAGSSIRQRSAEAREEWQTRVVLPAMRLATDTMPTLSEGWGKGLLIMTFVVWVMAFGMMCEGFDNGRYRTFALAVALSLLPLILAIDLAETSSQCNELRRVLNDVRVDNPTEEVNAALSIVETALDKLNRNQGLGFTVMQIVIDKFMLKVVAAKILVGLPTAIAAAVAISPAAALLYAPAAGVIQFTGEAVFTLQLPLLPDDGPELFALVREDNDCAFGFSGWILSTDPTAGNDVAGSYIFDFYFLEQGLDSEHVALHYALQTGKLCYDVLVGDASGAHTGADVMVGVETGAHTGAHICAEEPYPSNEWHHVAVTHADGLATMYFDGTIVASGAVPQPNAIGRDHYTIGSNSGVNGFNEAPKFKGAMLDLRWWDKLNATDGLHDLQSVPPVLSAGIRSPSESDGAPLPNSTSAASCAALPTLVAKCIDGAGSG